jgi:4-diphosphocytidyl-2C-methyl-D-erythritol kinase
MPRPKKATRVTSALQQVQKQARALLISLRKEIVAKEQELLHLKNEEASLGRLTGSGSKAKTRANAAKATSTAGRATRGGRVNWRSVLEQLPKQFKAAEVRDIRGLKGKRPSEIFAAITRWIEGGIVRRKARGLYERV